MSNHLDPSHIMQVGMGFWPSKVLLSAVKLGLFTFLGQDGKRTGEIKDHLGLQTSIRHVCDWLDALVSLGFLHRDGLMEAATYSNTPHTLGLLMSLNMLIENGDGFDYSHQDFQRWATAAGFRSTKVIPLAGPTSAAIAYK